MFISRRKAIASLLVTGLSLTAGMTNVGSAFAAVHSPLAQKPEIKKLKASIKKQQITLQKHKLSGKGAKATLKSYTPKVTTQASPLLAADAEATFTEYRVKTTSNPNNRGITAGDNGEGFWFTEVNANRIGKITPQGAITEYSLPLNGYEPRSIANGPDDTLWFTYNKSISGGTNYIGRFTVGSKQVTLFALPNDLSYGASSIVRGPNDTLWFAGANYNSQVALVGSLTAQGAMTIYTIPNATSSSQIAAGPDGALWFNVSANNLNDRGLGRLTTSGDYTFYPLPYVAILDIATGRDNDLWLTTEEDNVIGRITTSGQLTSYALPKNQNAYPDQITHLGNGTFAFGTATSDGRPPTQGEYIGTITPSGDVQLFATPGAIEASDMVYAGWANEVWFTTPQSVYKFRVTN
jgi:virginiamycin B lyase